MIETTMEPGPEVLVTGATGFVGRNLRVGLARRPYRVRGMTRDPEQARRRAPDVSWVTGDVGRPETLEPAMYGCRAAYYLVHSMSDGGPDFRQREVIAAQAFAESARRAGLERIVYLGGVAPQSTPSEHLRSRLEVGEVLRSGSVPTLELRASMIIGHGSLSWLIVRDLAARLPFMVLPRWLNSKTEPVGIDDVVTALVRGLQIPLPASRWSDIPGPEAISGKEILIRTAQLLSLQPPIMVTVPVLSPWLSSHWVHFVSRAPWSIAREIVVGLADDLLATSDDYWTAIGHGERLSFDEAARRALAAEDDLPAGLWHSIEHSVRRWRGASRDRHGRTDHE